MDISSIKVPNGNTYTFKDTVARKRMTDIIWSNLVSLRNNNQLIPGMQYRITDYHTTTSQKDTRSADHQFDIIVTADSTNKLNESARAIQHNGDTYFSNCNLAAWKIWYCLDNDTKRFAWADATNGKGVIYRMIDEHNNDCPYDFKNIQFKRHKITAAKSSNLIGTYLGVRNNVNTGISIDSNDSKMFYTFSYLGELDSLTDYKGEVLQDASIVGNTLSNIYTKLDTIYGVYNNSIKRYMFGDVAIHNLNNIVFLTFLSLDDEAYEGCYSNSFGNDCNSNSFGNDCKSNSFGNDCKSNSFGNDCKSNSFGNDCKSNSFGNNCNYNSFGNNCIYNSFGNDCKSNSFGNNCIYNSFGNGCYSNSFGIDSSYNKINAYYKYNKFDNGVYYVTFSGTGTSSNYVQNYHIKQGMTFTNNSIHTITAKSGLRYELSVAKQTDGTVVEYCEADLKKS